MTKALHKNPFWKTIGELLRENGYNHFYSEDAGPEWKVVIQCTPRAATYNFPRHFKLNSTTMNFKTRFNNWMKTELLPNFRPLLTEPVRNKPTFTTKLDTTLFTKALALPKHMQIPEEPMIMTFKVDSAEMVEAITQFMIGKGRLLRARPASDYLKERKKIEPAAQSEPVPAPAITYAPTALVGTMKDKVLTIMKLDPLETWTPREIITEAKSRFQQELPYNSVWTALKTSPEITKIDKSYKLK